MLLSSTAFQMYVETATVHRYVIMMIYSAERARVGAICRYRATKGIYAIGGRKPCQRSKEYLRRQSEQTYPDSCYKEAVK